MHAWRRARICPSLEISYLALLGKRKNEWINRDARESPLISHPLHKRRYRPTILLYPHEKPDLIVIINLFHTFSYVLSSLTLIQAGHLVNTLLLKLRRPKSTILVLEKKTKSSYVALFRLSPYNHQKLFYCMKPAYTHSSHCISSLLRAIHSVSTINAHIYNLMAIEKTGVRDSYN